MAVPRAPFVAILAALTVAAAAAAGATVLLSVEEALALAFPGATTRRETLFLTDEQLRAAQEAGGVEVSSALVTRFVATDAGGALLGYAYLDTHRVRTLPETLMVAVGADGRVARVEVVVFREPVEYMPREGWYRQYEGGALDDELALKRGIRPVTGATLTARATTEAVRRVLAVHRASAAGNPP
ncbi:MAG TPA: FMN-binding protein [Chondromyces sp.]|nr:FMN-binding protein [Chondromyces sp.]